MAQLSTNYSEQNPLLIYEEREKSLLIQNKSLARWENLLGQSRILWFVLFGLLCWLSLGRQEFSAWLLLATLPPFIVLLVLHEKVTRAWQDVARNLEFYQSGVARLKFKWQGKGSQGMRFRTTNHPYADDLDIFGTGSLFELLCIANTLVGQKTLAEWLQGPADATEIILRQQSIRELAPLLSLRQEMNARAGSSKNPADIASLVSWADQPPHLLSKIPLFIALALACYSLFSIHACVVLGLGLFPIAIAIFVNIILHAFMARSLEKIYQGVDLHTGSFGVLSRAMAFLENNSFNSAKLKEMKTRIQDTSSKNPPSVLISNLAVWIDLSNALKNLMFSPVGFLLNWKIVVGYGLENWRTTNGKHVHDWMKTIGQFEALNSFANYSYENPEDIFPELSQEKSFYHATGLGHPLMYKDACVRNDLEMDSKTKLMIVSGSNMSGKSTYLRTVGINTVLAFAGAAVKAKSMQISPMALAAVLKIQDSLAEGKSRFYAEIQRVRQVVDLADGLVPVFFLLDEIFSGTNSHDRKLGASGVLKGLIRRSAIGIVTTHDLSLAAIADQSISDAKNTHFADRFEEGNLNFDYTMKPGVVRHSNALELMRAVGLEIDPE